MTLSNYGRNCSEVSIYRGHSYFGSLTANNEQSLSFRHDYMLLACGQCLPCSALSQFPNEMTHELILLNKGCPKCFSPHGQAQNPGSPNLPSPALTPRVYTCWWRDLRVPCIALNPVPRGHNFLCVLTTPHSGKHSPQRPTKHPRLKTSIWQLSSPNHSKYSCVLQLARKRTRYGSEKIPDITQVKHYV